MSIVEEMHSLVEGIVSASEARADGLMLLRREVAAQQEEAHVHIRTVHSGRQAAARQQRAALSREHAGLARAEAERGSRFQRWLREVSEARQGLAQQQRAALAQGERERSTELRGWLGDVAGARQGMTRQRCAALAQGQEELAREVGGWLRKVSDERQAAQMEWQRMATIRGERASISKASETAEEFSRLGERVFAGLADHSDGLRLTEIEREFGMSRFQSTRVVKSLMDNGKAEKRGLVYFAI